MEDGEVAILESEIDKFENMTVARYTGAPAPTVMSKNTRGHQFGTLVIGFFWMQLAGLLVEVTGSW